MTTEAAAIFQGSLVDVKNIATHKSVRLCIDVPAELGQKVIDAFGWPTMVNPVPVAIARLNEEGGDANNADRSVHNTMPGAEEPAPSPSASGRSKRHFDEMPLSQQAALMCDREDFISWIVLRHKDKFSRPPASAVVAVRSLCGVLSRSEFNTDPEAAQRWRNLYSEFRASQLAMEHERH